MHRCRNVFVPNNACAHRPCPFPYTYTHACAHNRSCSNAPAKQSRGSGGAHLWHWHQSCPAGTVTAGPCPANGTGAHACQDRSRMSTSPQCERGTCSPRGQGAVRDCLPAGGSVTRAVQSALVQSKGLPCLACTVTTSSRQSRLKHSIGLHLSRLSVREMSETWGSGSTV